MRFREPIQASRSHVIGAGWCADRVFSTLDRDFRAYGGLYVTAGGGFYDYTSQPPELWSGLKTFERRSRQLDAADIRDRLLYAAWMGALDVSTETPAAAVTQTFGETVATNASQAHAQMQRIGPEAFLARARDLATRFGARFEPPPSITAGSTAA